MSQILKQSATTGQVTASKWRRNSDIVRAAGSVGLAFLFAIVLFETWVRSDMGPAVIHFSRGTVPAAEIETAIVPQLDAAMEGNVGLRIVGHTEPQGDRLANVRLGAARAEVVAQALIDAGLPADKIIWESAGGEAPVICDAGASQRACDLAQARVEITVLGTINTVATYLGLASGAVGSAVVGAMAISRRRRERMAWHLKALGIGLCAGGFSAAMLAVGSQWITVGLMAIVAYLCASGAAIRMSAPDPWKGRNISANLKSRVDAARSLVERIKSANHRIPSPELSAALDTLYNKGQRIIGLLEAEPILVRRSDRFLTVYLDGAARVSEKYADIHRETDSVDLDQSYQDFLDRTIRTFDQQHAALIADDVLDLDIEIEVLQKRMASEGIK